MALTAKGYRVVPQNLADSGRGFRHVHLKEHRGAFKTTRSSVEGEVVREVVFAKGRTLFVGNIDDQGGRLCRRTIEARLRRSLSSCGGIAHVQASSAATGERATGAARFAHICFTTAKGVQQALSLPELSSGTITSTPGLPDAAADGDPRQDSPVASQEDESRDENGDEASGYAALIQRHRRQFPPRQVLQSEVDSCMNRFQTEEAEEAAQRKALLQNPVDDDGFVTVTYKRKRGRNSGSDGPGPEMGGVAEKGNKKKRKGAGELSDFYRFQMRETKREQLATLRSKFEQDKARVAKMKMQRKFRPF